VPATRASLREYATVQRERYLRAPRAEKRQLLDRRRIRFRVHRAAFISSGREALFFNLTNLSKAREIEITHVSIASSPPVAALQAERPLPKRLKPDESWETWVYVDMISPAARACRRPV
jgi:hypothetical protein